MSSFACIFQFLSKVSLLLRRLDKVLIEFCFAHTGTSLDITMRNGSTW